MIVPSIDIMHGRAVQLRHGREFVLDAGDPLEWLERFSIAGAVAVVDLDAALGIGSNAALIRTMVRRASCRVGGGIRDLDTARAWLDAGATRIVIGTAATPAFCAALPRERVIAAVDCRHGSVVVNGWQTATGRAALEVIPELSPHVSGFLLTQVEHEGAMQGFDGELVRAAIRLAGDARVTAAGGITTADDIAALERDGADAQVGMALYSGALSLGDAIGAALAQGTDLWPTIVADEAGRTLGLAWSSRDSLRRAVEERLGVYWSRSRRSIWVKGETSGNHQRLLSVQLDCDRDALLFVVRQEGSGFCHQGTRSCFGDRFDLGALERTIAARASSDDASSATRRLMTEAGLLAAKLREEAGELAIAESHEDVIHEAADLMYMLLATTARAGVTLADIEAELGRRNLRVTRRPMEVKAGS
ncbi:MAG TPA: phosphoribosyl-ATP diphosphatase [Gemmatimonadaceae bacterium]|nr:phosphoribosyl-ATP diphosphatase [Gemmatimonadaceae bacterium]